ncbi:MAG: nitroreductase [Actinobacteria bacterium]|nr:nitroreductase [Actinomycetota bacterium]
MNDANIAAVEAVLARRSVKHFDEPGPSDAQLEVILRAATTVPDHNELHPWRFVVVSGAERAAFGEALVAAGAERDPDMDEARRTKLRDKAYLAPTLVVIVFSPKPGKVDVWEQEASAAATGYAMTLAAHLLGVGSIWKSAPLRTGAVLAELFSMVDDEQLMGWVNLGTVASPPRARRNPVGPADVTRRLRTGRLEPWPQQSGEPVVSDPAASDPAASGQA